jgi:ABC-type phosphate transport system auxiliary subunit
MITAAVIAIALLAQLGLAVAIAFGLRNFDPTETPEHESRNP